MLKVGGSGGPGEVGEVGKVEVEVGGHSEVSARDEVSGGLAVAGLETRVKRAKWADSSSPGGGVLRDKKRRGV